MTNSHKPSLGPNTPQEENHNKKKKKKKSPVPQKVTSGDLHSSRTLSTLLPFLPPSNCPSSPFLLLLLLF